jgi:Ribonuclease G/E
MMKSYTGKLIISIPCPEKKRSLNPKCCSYFEHYGVEKQIKSAFGKTNSFKNGAYLIIEHTEARHIIDKQR